MKKEGSSVSTDQGVPHVPLKEDVRPWDPVRRESRVRKMVVKIRMTPEGKRYVFIPCVHLAEWSSYIILQASTMQLGKRVTTIY